MKNDELLCKQKQKSKISTYHDRMFIDGIFNPICPIGYNYLTGYIEVKPVTQIGLREYNITARINGTANISN